MLAQRTIWSALALLGLTMASVTAAPLPEPKAVTVDESKWLLPEAEAFFKFNIKQMMGSDLMTKGGTAAMKEAIKSNAQLKAVLDATELDPAKDVDSILLSASGTKATDVKALIVIRGTFNQNKIHAALDKASKKEEKLKLVKEGTTQLYEIQTQDQPLYGAFVDRSTFVLTPSKEATVDAVKNGGKKVVALNKSLKTALGKFTGKESMAMALVVNDEAKKALAALPNFGAAASKLETVTASITLSDAVVVNAAGNTNEEKSARQLKGILEALKGAGAALGGQEVPPVVGDVLDAIKITSTKEAVVVDLKVTKEMIDKAKKAGDK